jgi:hypothetical protein
MAPLYPASCCIHVGLGSLAGCKLATGPAPGSVQADPFQEPMQCLTDVLARHAPVSRCASASAAPLAGQPRARPKLSTLRVRPLFVPEWADKQRIWHLPKGITPGPLSPAVQRSSWAKNTQTSNPIDHRQAVRQARQLACQL